MSLHCKYCNEIEDKQENPGFVCQSCKIFVHLSCLQSGSTPGNFSCDVFFDFVCQQCSHNNEEILVRNKFPWLNVIVLSLHHLNSQSYGISNRGYFHYKTHICSFIDRNWNLLFGSHAKQKKNWVGTIAGVLSIYNNLFFKSGSTTLGETGWWRLLHKFSPAVTAHIIQEMNKDKPKTKKGSPRNQPALDQVYIIMKVTELGYYDLLEDETTSSTPPPALKRERSDSSNSSVMDYTEIKEEPFDIVEESMATSFEEKSFEQQDTSFSEDEATFKGFSTSSVGNVPQSDDDDEEEEEEEEDDDDGDDDDNNDYTSDTRSASPLECREKIENGRRQTIERPKISLFSDIPNSVDLPWRIKRIIPKELERISTYDEVNLLKEVDNLIPKVDNPNKKAYLCRLRAKLSLCRLKRHKHIPIFDVDEVVRNLGGYTLGIKQTVFTNERVLDKFQQSYLADNLCGTIANTGYGTTLISNVEPTTFRSAYSGVILKPFIRRDAVSTPRWLQVIDELLTRTNRGYVNEEGIFVEYQLPAHATIDYSYVRPHHIAAVNNLCAQFFWPGIDLTETLQYPEFSCVVTYKQLVIGCAFMVPDVNYNEAYISFVLVRPEWRNAKIASFMLYHLLQTSTGKDVTLHVSPTNPAVFLYQKFGFKVEELIQDFYEKYYDMEYKGCRHALFLRLVR